MYINPHNNFDTLNDKATGKIIGLLMEHGTEVQLKAGDPILKEGQLCNFFLIVLTGCFRAYRLVNDREVIVGFSFKGDFDTAPFAFINHSHSTETIEAVTESSAVKVYRSTLESLRGSHPGLQHFTEQMLAHYIEVLVKRHIDFKTYTAEQLYHTLYRRQPEAVKQIPLKYIASYLGISQERLSRIRAKSSHLT